MPKAHSPYGPASYTIQPYTRERAKHLRVSVKPSANPKKKIDVFRDGKKIASVGAIGYKDFPTYLLEDTALANEKRSLYKARHQKTRRIVDSPSYWADQLLW